MSRRTVVSDSSVLVDLERGDLFAAAFALRFEFCVPDLLFKRELQQRSGDRLLALGLKVLALDASGISKAMHFRKMVAALSLPDAFALAMVCFGSWTGCTTSKQQRRAGCTMVSSVFETTHDAGCQNPRSVDAS